MKFSRRSMLAKSTVVMGLVMGMVAVTSCSQGGAPASSQAGQELNVITWQGYTNPEWIAEFQKDTGVKVNITYIGSDDELIAKVKANADNIDVYGANRSYVPPMAKAGYFLPLDTTKIAGWDGIDPTFTKNELAVVDGKNYMAPYVWGGMGLDFDKATHATPPDSWSAVFEPSKADCGKVLWPDDAGIVTSTAALYLGFADPYKLSEDERKQVTELLQKARHCVVGFYSGQGDAANYLVSGRATVALATGAQLAVRSRKDGAAVQEIVPKEKALGWSDGWSLVKGSKDKQDAAYKFISFMITADQQARVARATGNAPVVPATTKLLTSQEISDLKIEDKSYSTHLSPMKVPEAPDSLEARQTIWNVVKSGS